MGLDSKRLLAYLKAKADHPNLLIHARCTGVATAVERGDYDEKEGD